MKFNIAHTQNKKLKDKLLHKMLKNPKPFGALGFLEGYAVQLGLIQKQTEPKLKKPTLLLFAADHGFAQGHFLKEAAQPSYTSLVSLLQGETPINTLLKRCKVRLNVIDVGLASSFEHSLVYWLYHGSSFFDRKLKEGSENVLYKPAMSTQDCKQAIQTGVDAVQRLALNGTNTVIISHYSKDTIIAAITLACSILQVECNSKLVGKLVDEESVLLVERASKKHPKSHDMLTNLTVLGGFDLAAMVGAYLKGAEQKMVLLVDNFASATAAACAIQINPAVADYCVWTSNLESDLYQLLIEKVGKKGLFNVEQNNQIAVAGLSTIAVLKSACDLLKI